MKIGILGAMVEEIEHFLTIFEQYEKVEYAGNTYYLTSYKSIDVVVAYSKIGKVFASLSASVMIEHFNCEKILFSGVAGGLSEKLGIGDLIIADKLAQHDLDITAFGHPFGFVPGGEVFIKSDDTLNDLAIEVAKASGITLQKGIVATGDQFVSSQTKKDFIKETFDADAVEMEGGAVACVCSALGVPFLILRAISDTAQGDAVVDFDAFLESSSKRSGEFLLKLLDRLC